jgi:hypothetical protein
MMHTVAVGLASLAVGCSGASTGDGGAGGAGVPSVGASMFDAPSGAATPGSIYGVWGGTLVQGDLAFDTRMKLASGSVTVASRCTRTSDGARSGIVGVTAAARITADAMDVLESKSDTKDDGVLKCTVNVTPRQLPRCAAGQPAGFERGCFKLDGTTLVEFGTNGLDKLELTKLSD